MMVFIIDLTVVCDVDVDADAMRALSLSTIPKFSLSCKSSKLTQWRRGPERSKNPKQKVRIKAFKRKRLRLGKRPKRR
jgi:hypothetical protein